MLAAPSQLSLLHSFELERIVDAIRRDMRHEEERVHTDPQWADVHAAQARHDKALLEILNPKFGQAEYAARKRAEAEAKAEAEAEASAPVQVLPAPVPQAVVVLTSCPVKRIPLLALFPLAASVPDLTLNKRQA